MLLATKRDVSDLLEMTPPMRRGVLLSLSSTDRDALLGGCARDYSTPYYLWHDDPVGFNLDVLGEQMWGKQAEIARSVEANERTAVPACFSAGKTFEAARILAWFCSVWPVGDAVAVSTAPRMRQVKLLLWPHIRRAHAHGHLLGQVDMTQWKVGNEVVSYGFAASEYDETSTSGIHAPHVLVVIDEAGGVGHTVGRSLEGLMSGAHVRMLAIGNPPTDEEGSWFEGICASPLWHTIPLPVEATPNFTGEAVPEAMAAGLVTPRWLAEVTEEFGEDSAYVQAKAHARFPRAAANKAIPWAWVEGAMENETPDAGTWVRLGVDVASDGGDELAIARAEGFTVRLVHASSGEANANPVDVAGRILLEILEAEETAKALGSTRAVRVKVDAIGLGWGVAGILESWRTEGRHHSEIVRVIVSERAVDTEKYSNKRAEMWWGGRLAFQTRPHPDGRRLPPAWRLDLDRRSASQLSAPTFGSDTQGRIKIEPKSAIKSRGIGSPDRAESVLLALYEPHPGTASVSSPVGRRVPPRRPRSGPSVPRRVPRG